MPELKYTKKPCPGCGVGYRRPIDSVCEECKGILARHRSGKAEREQRKGPLRPYRVPRNSYSIAYIPHDAFDHQVQPALFRLMLAVSELADCGSEYDARIPALLCESIAGYREGSVAEVRLFRPDVAERLNEMLAAIGAGMVHAYAEGKERGTSLLMGLQSGELSSSDYEKRRSE